MLGQLIQAHRDNLGLSRREFANRVGVSDSTVANWERGKSIPYQKNLEKIAAVVGTTVDELIGAKSEREAVECERPIGRVDSMVLPFVAVPMMAGIPPDRPAPVLAYLAARNNDMSDIRSDHPVNT